LPGRFAVSGAPLFHRSEQLVGADVMARLREARVILFGVGGVGSWCAEALVRSGVGHLALVDSDRVCITNVNRQVQALPETVGCFKVDALADRLRRVNPDADIRTHREAYGEDTAGTFGMESYDYVLDAIDTLSRKLGLIIQALSMGRKVYSSMSASARLDPTRVRVCSVWETRDCPLARKIRKRLRHHGVTSDLTVVYSEELLEDRGGAPVCGSAACHCPRFEVPEGAPGAGPGEWCSHKASLNGSMMPVVATFGLTLASLVLQDVFRLVNSQGAATLAPGHPAV